MDLKHAGFFFPSVELACQKKIPKKDIQLREVTSSMKMPISQLTVTVTTE